MNGVVAAALERDERAKVLVGLVGPARDAGRGAIEDGGRPLQEEERGLSGAERGDEPIGLELPEEAEAHQAEATGQVIERDRVEQRLVADHEHDGTLRGGGAHRVRPGLGRGHLVEQPAVRAREEPRGSRRGEERHPRRVARSRSAGKSALLVP